MTAKRSYGTIRYVPLADDGLWVIQAQPDVAARLKNIFPQVRTTTVGAIQVHDSPDIAQDLEWVLGRWPMDLNRSDRERLAAGAHDYRVRGEQIAAILEGRTAHPALRLTPQKERTPREYQMAAYQMLLASKGVVLSDELGLGKTLTSLLMLSDPSSRPMLAVTLVGLTRQWVRELEMAFPDLRAVEVKKGTPYDLRDAEGHEPDMIVMNYAKLAGWANHLAGKVRTVVFDEVQELRRPGSKKHTAAMNVAHKADLRMGLSATPVFNYGGEMHSILSVIRPDLTMNPAEFARQWCRTSNGLGDKTQIADPPAFRAWMTDNGAFLRRTREDVGIEMPPLQVQEWNVEVDNDNWKTALASSNAAEVARLVLDDAADHRSRWRASGDLDWRMRQATGVAKAPYVAELVKLILESEERILLGGWHRDCWNIWQAALAEFNPVLYTGTESPAAKNRAFDKFVGGDSRILMMSLRSGAGLDGLQGSARVAVFGELDWSPGVHKQFLGRLHRPGQREAVTGYFCVSNYGADPMMMDALDMKQIQSDLLIEGKDSTVREVNEGAKQDYLKKMARKALAA